MLKNALGENPSRLSFGHPHHALVRNDRQCRLLGDNQFGRQASATGVENALVDIHADIAISIEKLDERPADAERAASIVHHGVGRREFPWLISCLKMRRTA